MAKLDAIRGASLLASKQGLRKLVILTNGKGIEKFWSTVEHQHWKIKSLFEDLKSVQKLHDLQIHIKVVPNIIIAKANSLAAQASQQFLNVMHVAALV
jgi:hypothetical protein